MALSLYEKINYQDFRTSDILLNKGKTHSLKGEEYEAIHHFQKALAFNKNNQPVERAKNKAKIYNFLGQSYIQLNKLDSALYFINEAEKYALGESKSLNLITKSYLLNLQNQHNDALKIIQPIIDSVQQSETYSRLFIK